MPQRLRPTKRRQQEHKSAASRSRPGGNQTRAEPGSVGETAIRGGTFCCFSKGALHLPRQEEQTDDSGTDGDESVHQQVFDSPVH